MVGRVLSADQTKGRLFDIPTETVCPHIFAPEREYPNPEPTSLILRHRPPTLALNIGEHFVQMRIVLQGAELGLPKALSAWRGQPVRERRFEESPLATDLPTGDFLTRCRLGKLVLRDHQVRRSFR